MIEWKGSTRKRILKTQINISVSFILSYIFNLEKFFALKKPDGDLLSLNKLDQNVEMAVESFESTNSGMNRTQSEIDFIDLVRTRLNEKDAHKITKKGYQFNQ